MTEICEKILLKKLIFLKKRLEIPGLVCYYIQADIKSDEAEGGHSAEFSPAFMGNFRGASPA
jgi:hypothetical protein